MLRKCPGPDPDMHTYDWGRGKERRVGKEESQQEDTSNEKTHSDSLFIEGTAAAGGRAVFKEGAREFLVEVVRHWSRDSLPRQDEDHQHGGVAVVAGSAADQTQKLLLFIVPPNYLSKINQYDMHIVNQSKSSTI